MKRLLIAAMVAAALLAGAAGEAKAHDYDCWACKLLGYQPPKPPVYFYIQAIPGHDYWPMIPIVDPGVPLY